MGADLCSVRLAVAAEALPVIDRDRDGECTPFGIGHQRWAYPEHKLTPHDNDGEAFTIPVLRNVAEFEVYKSGRRICPTAISQIISSLSNLRKLEVYAFPVQPKYKNLRAEMRDNLAHALDNPVLENLEVLRIEMEEETPCSHNYPITAQEDPVYPDRDHLCRAVCNLAQRSLRELYMVGPCLISPALWGLSSSNLNTDKLEITFPHLETVKIEFILVTYDGRWYYTSDPSEALSDEGDDIPGQTDSQRELASDSDSGSCSSFNSEYHDEIDEDRQDYLNGKQPYNS
ncbi:hypothetical protein BJY01DRAFT_137459 [Aspergillus pseudoustus]|uniref:Uncharacterized protein n=1 Tax=Aspergillus pseudoustus TaxID=1810923 RepID=A0ABR4KYE9_9EURO